MAKFSVPSNLAVSESGFLFVPSSGETFTLNEIGSEIFMMLKKGSEDKEIFETVVDNYDIDLYTFEKDFSDFITQLKNHKLIKEL